MPCIVATAVMGPRSSCSNSSVSCSASAPPAVSAVDPPAVSVVPPPAVSAGAGAPVESGWTSRPSAAAGTERASPGPLSPAPACPGPASPVAACPALAAAAPALSTSKMSSRPPHTLSSPACIAVPTTNRAEVTCARVRGVGWGGISSSTGFSARGSSSRGTFARGSSSRGTFARGSSARGTFARGSSARGTLARGSLARGTFARGSSAGVSSVSFSVPGVLCQGCVRWGFVSEG
eukprot:scaffold23870_cov82-Isochrysis_galbana.AAC.1